MSKNDPLHIVQSFYEAFGAGNMEEAFSYFSDQIEWKLIGPSSIPYFGTFNGKSGVQEFFARLSEAEQLDEFQPQEFLAGTDTVTVLGSEAGSSKASGREFRSEWAQIFSVANGKITRFVEYIDTAPLVQAYE